MTNLTSSHRLGHSFPTARVGHAPGVAFTAVTLPERSHTLVRLHEALMPPTKRFPARLPRPGATSTPTWRPAGPSAGGWGSATGHLRPPSRLRPAQPAGPRAAPLPRKPEDGRPASRLHAGPGRQRPRRHSSLTRHVPAAPERGRSRKPLRASGRPRDRYGGGDTVTCCGLRRSRQRRSPGNRGSYPEAESRRAW